MSLVTSKPASEGRQLLGVFEVEWEGTRWELQGAESWPACWARWPARREKPGDVGDGR